MSDQVDSKAEPAAPPYHLPEDKEARPLPEGWIKQFDPKSQAYFYVDTKASPPRSIWVHPYDDHEYLEKHPDAKDYGMPHYDPPSGSPRPSRTPSPLPSSSHQSERDKSTQRRSFLGKLKDKAIGTKEEREETKRLHELERQERLARQREIAAQYGAPPQYAHYPGQGYGPVYGQPGQQPVIIQQQGPRRGNVALPLIGGLAGGLFLGSALGGGFYGGDGFDGGDFGGGDFGGGDFGGFGGD